MIGHLRSVALLAVVLAVMGCKQQAAQSGGKQSGAGTPAAEEGPTKEDIRKGIGKRLPIVQRNDAAMDLQNIAKLYLIDAQLGMPPKKVEDLQGLDARAVKAVKDGEYVVIWNAGPTNPGNAILAYEKNVPTRGGMVANFTGSVTQMSVGDFAAAPKAKER
jgi:hypothetical protein